MDQHATIDARRLYADTRDRCVRLFRSLRDDEDQQRVPLCPAWTVHDVAAHVCGINADVVSGNLDGLGTDDWTAAQVAARAGRTIGEICDEWLRLAPAIDERIAAEPFFGIRLTGDLIVHLQDVQHALGLPVEQHDDEATRAAAQRYVPPLQQRAAEQLAVGLAVELVDVGRFEPSEVPGVSLTLRATSYDFLRSVTGRRSRRQVASLDWEGDPTDLLDLAWTSYGPLRTSDVSV